MADSLRPSHYNLTMTWKQFYLHALLYKEKFPAPESETTKYNCHEIINRKEAKHLLILSGFLAFYHAKAK